MANHENVVRPTNDGFEWSIQEKGIGTLLWSEVECAEIFKRDLLTTDVVCMNLKLNSGGWFLLTEEVNGFIGVVKAMNDKWSLGDEWYRNVVLPPFETCKVVFTPPSELTGHKAVLDWSNP